MIRISPDSPPKSKIQDANKKMIRKMTALFKNRTMVQASSLGPNKHKRRRLRYLGGDHKKSLRIKCGRF